MKKALLILLPLLVVLTNASAQSPDTQTSQRPKVGLALSGGGAKGAAHIGVLKYLEEIGIPVDYVAGTSMGSIIGGLYSLGYTPDEMADLIADMDWSIYMSNNVDRYYQSSTIRARRSTYLFSVPFGSGNFEERSFNILSTLPSGVINGASLINLFSRLSVGYNDTMDFHKLPIPFSCVATDILTGDSVILDHGLFPKAIRSSMAIPGVFSPVEWDGHLLADGGMVNNFPVDLCLKMGANYVIGIELAEELRTDPEEMKSLPQQLSQYLSIAVQNNRSENRKLCNIYMHPDITGYNMLSFSKSAIDTMVMRGYLCAKAHRQELLALKAILEQYGPCHKTLQAPRVKALQPDDSIWLSTVYYRGVLRSDANWLINKGGLRSGSFSTINEIQRAIGLLMGTEAYSSILYNLYPDSTNRSPNPKLDAYRLVINFEPAEPHLLSLGFRYDSQEKAALLLHIGINEQKLSGFKLGIDANLNYNIRLGTKLSWCNMGLGDVNFAYRYHNSTLNLSASDTSAYSVWKVNHHNFSLFISEFHLRDITFAFGLDEDIYSNLGSFSLDNVLYDGIFHFDHAKGFFGAFFHSVFDNLDNPYFATRGFYGSADMGWHIDNNYLFKQMDLSFLDFSLSAQTYLEANPKLTFIPQLNARLVLGKNSAWYDNLVGGSIPGRYLDHQLAFMGLIRPIRVDDFAAIARVDVRYRLFNKVYLYFMPNVIYSSDWPGHVDATHKFNFGFALRAAYNSPLGPISLDFNWNDFTRRAGLYLNIGYVF
ncbi:MAG: patatin-like phospholipase family protein [Bacteroidales bacterium]|nr:patatin-like phospholipase family protein [Bacteroidales bacterium]